MLKLLIVDDEMLIRIGMRSIISWEEQGIEIVGEAEDGEQALEMAQKYIPDIVLVDIRMPKMDGLSFIRKLKTEQPECKFLVLSCMDDIAYLQEAIKLGVCGYILKNAIEPQNILDEVVRIKEKINRERVYEEQNMEEHRYVNTNAVLNEFANMALRGFIKNPESVRMKFEGAFLGRDYSKVFLLRMYIPPDEIKNAVKGVEYSIACISQNIMEGMASGRTFIGKEEELWAVVGSESGASEEIIVFCKRLAMTLHQYLDMNLRVGCSSFQRDDFNLNRHYERAGLALNSIFYHPGASVRFFEDSDELHSMEADIQCILEKVRKIENIGAYRRNVEDLMRLLSRYPLIGEKELKAVICQGISSYYEERKRSQKEKKNILCRIEACQNGEELLEILLQWAEEFDYILSYPKDELVERVVSYIRGNIGEKLTLSDLAQQVYLNPDYLCRIFKKKTGENLISYILKYKINVAKNYLDRGYTNAEITEKLGFSSEGHFITTFKKYTNETPKAYKKRIHGD